MKKLFKGLKFGMRGKLLLLTGITAVLLYLTVNLCIELMIRPYMHEITLLNLKNTAAQRVEYFEDLKAQTERISSAIIESKLVQESLRRELSESEKTTVRYLLKNYSGLTVSDLLYVDNKRNSFSPTFSTTGIGYTMAEELFEDQRMEDFYAIPTWSVHGAYMKDTKGPRYLYITQNIRHMESDTKTGQLAMRISTKGLDKIIGIKGHENEKIIFLDHRGEPVYPTDLSQRDMAVIAGDYSRKQTAVSRHTDVRTGWTLLSHVQYSDLMSRLNDLQNAVFIFSTIMLLISMAAIILLTKHYLGPIQTIVKAMEKFSEADLSNRIKKRLPGEVGQIGETFNTMANDIEQLLEAEKRNREELKIIELDSLTYQINPHFIYNTLDNIYMLSRMAGDVRTGELIDALSKLLRISLSKGSSLIKLQAELAHVESYLRIQQIRYQGLFDFEIKSQVADPEIKVLRLILQPFVENSINHGFSRMESGGKITVCATRQENRLILTVEDNGAGIESEIIEKYSLADNLTAHEIEEIFPDKQGGYGIGNVIARLNLYYHKEYRLSFKNTGHGTLCEIILPEKLDFL